MATKKVSIKNYEKAVYKTQLTAYEYNDIISLSIDGIISLYDKGVYGFNTFTVNSTFVSVCTNINMDVTNVDAKLKLFEETDVMARIVQSIGEATYNRIISEIDLGLKYRISTNPETKLLLTELTNLIKNLTDVSKNVTDETLSSLLSSVQKVMPVVSANATE